MGNDACVNLEPKAIQLMGDSVSLGGSGEYIHPCCGGRNVLLPLQALLRLFAPCHCDSTAAPHVMQQTTLSVHTKAQLRPFAGGATILIIYYLTGTGGTVLDGIQVR